MSVVRISMENCIGCRKCVQICPMDVFRFDTQIRKSVITYPEDCQSCGQCYLNCPGHSLGFTDLVTSAALTAVR